MKRNCLKKQSSADSCCLFISSSTLEMNASLPCLFCSYHVMRREFLQVFHFQYDCHSQTRIVRNTLGMCACKGCRNKHVFSMMPLRLPATFLRCRKGMFYKISKIPHPAELFPNYRLKSRARNKFKQDLCWN